MIKRILLPLIAIIIVFTVLAHNFTSKINSQIGNTNDLSQIVLRGSLDVTDDKLESISLWSRGKEANGIKFEKVRVGSTVNVDILNCAGYISSATAALNEQEAWELKLLTETIAPDAVEKVKQCAADSTSKYISSNAFAVSPTDEKRKQIKLNKLEKPSLLTLPLSVQMWAKSDGIGNWADTDGDGKVDLLSVSGKCGTSEEYTCTRVLSWIGLSWTEIAYSKPA